MNLDGSNQPAPWVDGLTLDQVLRATAARRPDADAVVFPALGLRWSWRDFDAEVERIARGLSTLGVAPGEHLGVWSMNVPEWLVVQFAAARLAAVLVNVNPAYRLHELEAALALADVTTLFIGEPFKTSDFNEMIGRLCPEAAASAAAADWSCARLPQLKRLVTFSPEPSPGRVGWAELRAAADRNPAAAAADLAQRAHKASHHDVFNIQFTSGTTGLPKGAMLTHRNVVMNAYYVGQRLRYTGDDRVCIPVPFYHCFGCVLGNAVCAVYGATIVVPAPRFEPEPTLAAVHKERCTAIYGVPTMFVAELECPNRAQYDLTSLRTGIMSGAPCPLPLMNEVMNTLAVPEITIGYGQTEASPIITLTDVDDPVEIRVGTVGRPLPGLEVGIRALDTGLEAAPGEPGELWTRGHGVMSGYYRNADATATAIDSYGRLFTGDLAVRRPDGCYRIVGRRKELIIRGGENIHPAEVEEFLHHHPDVSEVAVVGMPDAVYGEVVSAWIVPKPKTNLTPNSIKDFCRGQIAHYKVPTYVEVIDELPRTVTGKVTKHVLRARGIELYHLGDVAATPTA